MSHDAELAKLHGRAKRRKWLRKERDALDFLALEVLSPLALTDRQDGRDIMRLWKTHAPELLPDHYGNWEPIDRVFDRKKIELALDQWTWPFLAQKKNPKMSASVWMRKPNSRAGLHSIVIFRLEHDATGQFQLLNLLQSFSTRLEADFACLHLFTQDEIQRGRRDGSIRFIDKRKTLPHFFIASQDLQRRLPDAYWATVFGPPYLKMLGKDRILSTPAYSARMISSEMILLQLTEALMDVAHHPEDFEIVRSRTMDHLGTEAFFDSRREQAHDYRVPDFDFSR